MEGMTIWQSVLIQSGSLKSKMRREPRTAVIGRMPSPALF
jgi:hypothetical protein